MTEKSYKLSTYRGLTIELAEDGSSYDVYEVTPIFKNKASILFGASTKRTFSLEDIKQKIDEAYLELRGVSEF